MDLKKVILVNPSLNSDGKKQKSSLPFPFASILILSKILSNSGHKVSIIDGNLYDTDECIEAIRGEIDRDTVCIGFSVMTSQVPWTYQVTKQIKNKFPQLCTVWGGFHPTLFPEQTVKNDNIDIVVVNDAAGTIRQLVDTISGKGDLSQVPGLYFKSGGQVIRTAPFIIDDISKIPFFDFSLINSDLYSHNSFLFSDYLSIPDNITFPILTGLGCAYKCKFCINVILTRRYRFVKAEEIVRRIEYLQNTYNARSFWFLDEDFFLNKNRLFRFLDLVEEKKLKFYWRANLRTDYFNDKYINIDLARRLGKNGLTIAVMGAESGSQNILDYISKGITVEDIIRSAETLSKTKIIAKYSFMAGLPGETREDIRKTYKLALKIGTIKKNSDLAVSPFKLYPGSPIYDQAIKDYGIYEPASLEEWTKVDYSEAYGYTTYKENSWIPDKKEFSRLRFIHDRFFGYLRRPGVMARFVSFDINIRFKLNFFQLLFIERFLVTFVVFVRKNMKNMHLPGKGG